MLELLLESPADMIPSFGDDNPLILFEFQDPRGARPRAVGMGQGGDVEVGGSTSACCVVERIRSMVLMPE